ncbi:MAG TPA: hypothetical protein VEX43_01925 [Chthoniobacterales bacterium]|nr:hypothetical protein [Chthoniobacterales bacterium]
MPVTIDQVEVESTAAPEQSRAPQTAPAKPDPREIERALHARRERLARVRAH